MNEHSPLRTLLHKKIRTCECSLNLETLPLHVALYTISVAIKLHRTAYILEVLILKV